jgi:hypothetical protein
MSLTSEFTRNRQPLFITGLHKSGTTWAANLLARHPEIYVNYEAGFLDHQELLSCGRFPLENQPDDESLAHILSEHLGRWADKPWNHWLEERNREVFQIESIRLLVSYIVEEAVLQHKPAARIWADKTPRTAIATIFHHFPDARVIYLMRDARDRAISLYYHCRRTEPWVIEATEGLRRMTWEGAFQSWVQDIELNEPFFSHPSCQLVRYEDLFANTPGELSRILNFLGVANDGSLCRQLAQLSSFENFTGGRKAGDEDTNSFYRKGISGDWRKCSIPEKLAPFWEICLETAATYGYSLERL